MLRLLGYSPALWMKTHALPNDFGGWEAGLKPQPHGMAGLDAMALARTNLEAGEGCIADSAETAMIQ